MKTYKIKDPFNLVIFGASGDLAKLKIFPSLYSLMEQKRLPKDFNIIGYSRTKMSREEFQKIFRKSIEKKHKSDLNEKILDQLIKKVHYFSGQYDQLEDYKKFKNEFLKTLNGKDKLTTIAYFSVPPVAFKPIIENLGKTKDEKDDLRLILEKPFGEDTKSAQELFHFVARYFDEEEVFLLDHYLGKTAVQSILNLRHSNRLLNLMMKGPEISNIQITAFENIGVKERAGYFDKVGTIKDMVQSHLLQILALVTMSIPITDDAKSLHREKYSILNAMEFIPSEKNIVLGQYDNYKKEKGVPKDSNTETFAALRLFIDRESWYNTPIYLRTGKSLHKKHTYVAIQIKKFAFQPKDEDPNQLIIELQPDEKINITLINKQGISSKHQEVVTSDSIACEGDDCLPEHSLLLLDVIRRRRLHFLSFPEIIATWQLTDKIINFIKRKNLKPEKYKTGSKGPSSQKDLTEIDNFKWEELE